MSDLVATKTAGKPWFWLVMAPLLFSVITSLIFVYIAVVGADQRVVDDYYTEGKTINHRFEADKLATKLGVGASVRIDLATGDAFVDISGLDYYPDSLSLHFSHPVKSTDDLTLAMNKVNTSRYRVELPRKISGRWYVQLSSVATENDQKWRLVGELDLNTQQELKLVPEVQ